MRGRVSITPKIKEVLLEGINSYLTISLSAGLAGVPHRTLYDWLERGKADAIEGEESEYAEVYLAVAKMRAQKAQHLLALIMQGEKSWTAYDRVLERCYRREYGGNSLEIEALQNSIDEVKAILSVVKQEPKTAGLIEHSKEEAFYET